MKIYNLSTIFTFGRHKGKTLEQVLKLTFSTLIGVCGKLKILLLPKASWALLRQDMDVFRTKLLKHRKKNGSRTTEIFYKRYKMTTGALILTLWTR